MSAYIILDIDIHDEAAYAEYRKLSPATVAKYEGRMVVRGGAAETLEGDWVPNRIVVIEFDSVERAKAWIDSPEYAEPRRMRQAASTGRAIVVEGA